MGNKNWCEEWETKIGVRSRKQKLVSGVGHKNWCQEWDTDIGVRSGWDTVYIGVRSGDIKIGVRSGRQKVVSVVVGYNRWVMFQTP